MMHPDWMDGIWLRMLIALAVTLTLFLLCAIAANWRIIAELACCVVDWCVL